MRIAIVRVSTSSLTPILKKFQEVWAGHGIQSCALHLSPAPDAIVSPRLVSSVSGTIRKPVVAKLDEAGKQLPHSHGPKGE